MTNLELGLNYLNIKNTGYIKTFRALRFYEIEETKELGIMIIANQFNFNKFIVNCPSFFAMNNKKFSHDMGEFYFKFTGGKDKITNLNTIIKISNTIFNDNSKTKKNNKIIDQIILG